MSHYLNGLVLGIETSVNASIFVPEHFAGEFTVAQRYTFRTGKSRSAAIVRLLNPFNAWRIWSQILLTRPDVIHIINGEGYPWTILWVLVFGRKMQSKMLMTIHDVNPHPGSFIDALNGMLRKLIYKKTWLQVHTCEAMKQLEAMGAVKSRILLAPHGDFSYRFLRHKRDIVKAAGTRRVLLFGRIEAYKGLEVLVRAASMLDKAFQFTVAGPGKIDEHMLARMKSTRRDFTIHNRFLPDAEVAGLFQQADVCVLPYIQATQSSVHLIAAAFDVPVVASDTGSFSSEVPLLKGILVPVGDAEALARGIKAAIGRQPESMEGRDLATVGRRFVELYEKVSDYPAMDWCSDRHSSKRAGPR